MNSNETRTIPASVAEILEQNIGAKIEFRSKLYSHHDHTTKFSGTACQIGDGFGVRTAHGFFTAGKIVEITYVEPLSEWAGRPAEPEPKADASYTYSIGGFAEKLTMLGSLYGRYRETGDIETLFSIAYEIKAVGSIVDQAGRLRVLSLAGLIGLELADVEDEERKTFIFEFKSDLERKLVTQIVASVLKATKFVSWRYGRRKVRGFDLTIAEAAEVELLYGEHRKNFAAEVESLYGVYIYKHNLIPPADDDGPREVTDEELEAYLEQRRRARDLKSLDLKRKRVGAGE